MKDYKTIEPKEFYHLYRSLSVESRLNFSEKIKRQDKYIARYNISLEQFDYLKGLLNAEQPNTIGEKADYDSYQMRQYFKGLTDLINSPLDFQILRQREKDAIIEEHKQIHKLLLTYKI
jgi:hypothetical protein